MNWKSPTLLLPLFLCACPPHYDPSSTICGQVVLEDTADVSMPDRAQIYSLTEGETVCDDDSGFDGVTWRDQLMDDTPVDDHGRFESQVEAGEYGVEASTSYYKDCESVSVDGVTCTEVTLELRYHMPVDAPNVYLYPEEPTQIRVRLPDPQALTLTDPPYETGWDVLAHPDGLLVTHVGERDYLFYEQLYPRDALQREAGWCVDGRLAQASMETTLEEMGFLPNEIADFADFWDAELPLAPQLTIYPQVDNLPALRIRPAPEQLLRVWFAVRSGCHPADPVALPSVDRSGYHAAEWGVTVLPPLEGAQVLVMGW